MPPPPQKKSMSVSYSEESVVVSLFRKTVFVEEIEDLEMRSSFIIWVGFESNARCPLRKRRGRQETAKRMVREDRGRDGSEAAMSPGTWSQQELGQTTKGSLGAFRESTALPTP